MSTPNPKPPPAADVPKVPDKAPRFGRPTKLTPELIKAIAATVQSGCYLDTAARYHGVAKASFFDWMKRGHKQKTGIYRDFLDALETAQAAADVRDHAQISIAAGKDWKAAVAHLKLRNPSRYNVQRMEATGANGGPIVTANVEASLVDLFTRLLGDDEQANAAEALNDEAP